MYPFFRVMNQIQPNYTFEFCTRFYPKWSELQICNNNSVCMNTVVTKVNVRFGAELAFFTFLWTYFKEIELNSNTRYVCLHLFPTFMIFEDFNHVCMKSCKGYVRLGLGAELTFVPFRTPSFIWNPIPFKCVCILNEMCLNKVILCQI